MAKRSKREQAIRDNPANVRFDDLDNVLRDYGFRVRTRGTSHHMYTHPSVPDAVNLPRHGATVKPMYVKQSIAAIDAVIAAQEEEQKP